MTDLFYIDLSLLKLGKIFDAVVPGTFIDMLGRKVTFKKADLQKYVKNTQDAIKAATTESGEVVAAGHAGLLMVKGPNVMLGYLNNEYYSKNSEQK